MIEHIPEGTVTFLFTDIEDHSRLWQAHAKEMPVALAEHDAILETAVREHNGHVIKNTGDGIFAAFSTAAEAAGAAVDAQIALVSYSWDATGPLRVRMALHTGEAQIRDGDYFGTAVIRAARIMSLAAGSQILISGTTAELVRDSLPHNINLINLGHHRLKGLQRRTEIYQIQHLSLPAEFPELKSAEQVPNNLPLQITSFVGRQREIADLSRLLLIGDGRDNQRRLVTLTGTGGTGKTRLSLRIAVDLLENFPAGVWFLELAALTDESQVQQALVSLLKLGEPRNITPLELLTSYLRTRKVLIIIDNCEHLIEACATLCDQLLRGCQNLYFITTSREALNISPETVYSVPPLGFIQSEIIATTELLQTDSVQLFIERASAVRPHYSPSDEDVLAIAEICRRLDGIPLAIELAAVRVNLLTPSQIVQRLDDRFRLLTGGSRTAMPRQQTLGALIDWSYQLLSIEEQSLLRRLSVFRGGWTLDAAETIGGKELDVLIHFPHLVNKSLVVAEEGDDGYRYSMLESIRYFAMEKLLEDRDEELIRTLHQKYFEQLAADNRPQFADVYSDGSWFSRCQQEVDNFRFALMWAIEHNPWAALKMSGDLSFFWARRGFAREGREILESALQAAMELDVAANQIRTRHHLAAAYFGLCQVDLVTGEFAAAQEAVQHSVDIRLEINHDQDLPFALGMLCFAASLNSDLDTAETTSQVLARRLRNEANDAAMSLLHSTRSGLMYYREGNLIGAQEHAEEGIIYARKSGSAWAQLFGVVTIARVLKNVTQGSFDYRRSFRELIDAFSDFEDFYFANVCRSELAHAERVAGNLSEAEKVYVQTIRIWREMGQKAAVAHQLECFAFLRQANGQNKIAAKLFGAAERLREEIGAHMIQSELDEYRQQVDLLRGSLPHNSLAGNWTEGRALDIDAALALTLENSG